MSQPNPYAPPSSDPSVVRMEVSDGSRWLVFDGELFVRDRASLPDVCISGSLPWEPGVRKSIPVHCSRLWVLLVLLTFSLGLLAKNGIQLLAVIAAGHLISNFGTKIRVMIYESSRNLRKKRLIHWIGIIWSTGFAVWLGEAFLRGAQSEFSTILLGCCLMWNYPTHRFRAVLHKDRWYELRGIHPAAIARLEKIQQETKIPREDIRHRRKR